MKYLAYRFSPGADLFKSLESCVEEASLDAACIVTLVGSLSRVCLRMAGDEDATVFEEPFEIVSCEGTLGKQGSHVHLAVSDGEGRTTGGHLLPGSVIRTTAELVLVDLSSQWLFERKHCEDSGYIELNPVSKN